VSNLLGKVGKNGSIAEKYTLYSRRTEKNKGNVIQNRLRVDNENKGLPDTIWSCIL
jgi:hypothetical protein